MPRAASKVARQEALTSRGNETRVLAEFRKMQGPVSRRPGRPPALVLDEQLLKVIIGYGQAHCTHEEMSALLGITQQTWLNFRQANPIVEKALAEAKAMTRLGLRRIQLSTASKGNAQMQIWLGKQLLEQKDRHEHTGPGGGPLQVIDVTEYTSERLDLLEQALHEVQSLGGPEPFSGDLGGEAEAEGE